MTYAIDFDGTLVEDKFPEIGEPIKDRVALVQLLKCKGHKIILWTCRTGESLQSAVDYCENVLHLKFDAVNQNLPEVQQKWGGDTRKVFADFYVDDKSADWQDVFREVMLP